MTTRGQGLSLPAHRSIPKGRPITPEQIEEALAVGRAARELTESPAYTTALRSLEAFHVAAMVSTQEGPQGTETRDHHHRMLCALRELHGDIAARALAVAELEQAIAATGDADDQEDDI